jgi:hypothetical protein
MAYKKSRKMQRSNKIEPSVQTLSFIMSPASPGINALDYIDLSQVASLVNRRFYRQGLNWAVAGFKFLRPAGYEGSVRVCKLPNTWVLANAWEKGMRTWTRMNYEALAEAPSIRPRFLDFKVFADADHHAAGFAANLLPISSDIGTLGVYAPGEWESSKFVIPDTTSAVGGIQNREIVAVGSNYPPAGASNLGAVSLIEGYAASRGLPNVLDPNTPDDAASADGPNPENWMSAVFNEGTQQDEQVIGDMITENNLAPYPFENDGTNLDTMYPGGANQGVGLQIHDLEYITPTTIGGTTRLKGGNFPCGLIQIESSNTGLAELSLVLQIDLIPGSHRGYLCEPMTEM